MRILRATNRWLLRAIEGLLVVLILALVLMGFGQVVLRFFDRGFTAINTILQLSVLWIAFLGAALATYRRKHIKIDILTQVLPDRLQRWPQLAISLIGLLLSIVLCIGGASYLRMLAGQAWSLERNPVWKGSFAIGFGLIALQFAFLLLEGLFPEKPAGAPARVGTPATQPPDQGDVPAREDGP